MNAENAGRKMIAYRTLKMPIEIISLSVFIGVYRWLKNVLHHRCTPMNTDKNLMKISGKQLLSPASFAGQVAS
jgi:hypothetical protein